MMLNSLYRTVSLSLSLLVQDAISPTAAVAVPRPCRPGRFCFSRSSVFLRHRWRPLLACSTWRRVCSSSGCSSYPTDPGCCGCDPQAAACSQVRTAMCDLKKGVTFSRAYVARLYNSVVFTSQTDGTLRFARAER